MFEYANYIKTIAETGSFTKAAEKLYVTQPALSLVVKKIEKEIGKELFIRNKRNVLLTENGQLYLKAAEDVARIEDRFKDSLSAPDSGFVGKLRVGGAGICVNYVIPPIIQSLNNKYPNLQIEIADESLHTLRNLLLNQKIDLLVDSEAGYANISHARLFPNILLYAIPKILISDSILFNKGMSAQEICEGKHTTPNAPKITLLDVYDIPYLSLLPENELYGKVETLFSHYGLRPDTLMQFNQQITSFRYAEQGFGAAFIGDTLIKAQPSDKLLFYLFDYELPKRWISVAYKSDGYLSTSSKLFIEEGRSIYQRQINFLK